MSYTANAHDGHTGVHAHNASAQTHVIPNDDPALDVAHEHQHGHLHHSGMAAHDDKTMYTTGTTFERSTIPDQDPMDHALHRRRHPEKEMGTEKQTAYAYADAEKGEVDSGTVPRSEEEDPKSHRWSSFYKKVSVRSNRIFYSSTC